MGDTDRPRGTATHGSPKPTIGAGSAHPSRRSSGLELLWHPPPWLEVAAVARPRVSGLIEEALTRWPGPKVLGERGAGRPGPEQWQEARRHRGDGVTFPLGGLLALLLAAPRGLPPASTECQLKEEAVETCPHSFYVIVVIFIILLIVFVGGVFLGPPLTPHLGPLLLERLTGDVFLLLFLLFLRRARS